jgi:hypothetical protein
MHSMFRSISHFWPSTTSNPRDAAMAVSSRRESSSREAISIGK